MSRNRGKIPTHIFLKLIEEKRSERSPSLLLAEFTHCRHRHPRRIGHVAIAPGPFPLATLCSSYYNDICHDPWPPILRKCQSARIDVDVPLTPATNFELLLPQFIQVH